MATSNLSIRQPTKQQIANGTYKIIDSKWHKLCTGLAHAPPGQYLPANEKYFYVRKTVRRERELFSRCRLCANWDKLKSPGSETGYIEVDKARDVYVEVVNRIGVAELARRSGLSETHILSVLLKRQDKVQKAKLRLAMLELISAKRKGEYSISAGSRWRNEKRVHGNGQMAVCSGCGTELENYSEDCPQCWERQRGKERRNDNRGLR